MLERLKRGASPVRPSSTLGRPYSERTKRQVAGAIAGTQRVSTSRTSARVVRYSSLPSSKRKARHEVVSSSVNSAA